MTYFKTDPLMDSLREDQKYKDFLRALEMNFEMERQKVEAWLDERLINNSMPG